MNEADRLAEALRQLDRAMRLLAVVVNQNSGGLKTVTSESYNAAMYDNVKIQQQHNGDIVIVTNIRE